MSSNGMIFNIQRFSVNDGPGIRTTVFFKGCPLNCWWCHNPEGLKFGQEKINDSIIGSSYSVNELYSIIEKDRVFYEESGGGVTFSGGEPLSQIIFLHKIIKECKSNGIETAVDTSGYADMNLIKEIYKDVNLFLFDLKFVDPVSHLKYTGVSNQEILENLQFLLDSKIPVTVRIPLIPNITATENNLHDIKEFIQKDKMKIKIDLLPYHRIAESKYKKYGINYQIEKTKELSEQEVLDIFNFFDSVGFAVSIGG